ncbi:MAG TPA: DUF6293 family protein [Candidatus Lokiarchaeia archaeon]|nr:DUF6293 family protein [Candidatus Lokiarchaeia archaeon]
MGRKVMVAPVGFEFDRVIDGQKYEPCNVWYVLRNPQGASDAVGEYSIIFSDRVVEKIATLPLQEWHAVDVRQSDLLGLVQAFANIVKDERSKDPEAEFVFNASSSTKTAQCAAALVAGLCPAPVKLLYLRPREEITLAELVASGDMPLEEIRQQFLEHGECHAPFVAEYFPVVPLAPFTPAEVAILKNLAETKTQEAISNLVGVIVPRQGQPARKDLVKAGWSVKALERMRLVKTQKVNQMKSVTITLEGEVIAAALDILTE